MKLLDLRALAAGSAIWKGNKMADSGAQRGFLVLVALLLTYNALPGDGKLIFLNIFPLEISIV